MKTTRITLAGVLSLLVLGRTWLLRGQDFGGHAPNPFKWESLVDGSPRSLPDPRIAKDWKLVAVEHSNVTGTQTHLWFQDKEGNIFLLTGRLGQYDEFVLNTKVNVLEVEK